MRSTLHGMLRRPDFDVVLAVVAFIALLADPIATHEVKELTPLDAALALVAAMPLALRRRYPLGVLATVVPLLLACLAVFHPTSPTRPSLPRLNLEGGKQAGQAPADRVLDHAATT